MNVPEGFTSKDRKLGLEWTNDSRHRRIEEVLKPMAKVTLADSMKLQMDLTPVVARRAGSAVTLNAAVTLDALECKSAKFKVDARALLLAALASAYAEWEKLGRPVWGALHRSLPSHPLRDFVTVEWRKKLQPEPYSPWQSMHTGNSFQLTNGPSFRMVLDVGIWDESGRWRRRRSGGLLWSRSREMDEGIKLLVRAARAEGRGPDAVHQSSRACGVPAG